jgi:hypothetical protein
MEPGCDVLSQARHGLGSLATPNRQLLQGMETTMFESELRFPVACPTCGKETLSGLPVTIVTQALRVGAALTLRSHCHEAEWTATPLQMEQIQQYLAIAHGHGERSES